MCKLNEWPWNFYVLDVLYLCRKKNTGCVAAILNFHLKVIVYGRYFTKRCKANFILCTTLCTTMYNFMYNIYDCVNG
jgi:hypothetical protein